jgi:hypothetical protein
LIRARLSGDKTSPREGDAYGRQGEIHFSGSCHGACRLRCQRRRGLHQHRLPRRFRAARLSAFIIGWPVASVTGLLAFPTIRRATSGIVVLIERA